MELFTDSLGDVVNLDCPHGYVVVPRHVFLDPRLSPFMITTLCFFYMYAGGKHKCWPGQKTFADQLGVSDRHLRRVIGDLKGLGYLSTKRRGQGRSSVYYLHIPKIQLHRTLVSAQARTPMSYERNATTRTTTGIDTPKSRVNTNKGIKRECNKGTPLLHPPFSGSGNSEPLNQAICRKE